MVSVIIPCYNAENWILECLKSVINQTYKNIEVLIVDDGSTDNTHNLIKTISDSRIVYYFKTNGGHSSARNLGLKNCNGDWIAFLDSDDIWDINKIETLLLLSEESDFIYHDAYKIDEKGKILLNTLNINPKLYNYNFKTDVLLQNRISGGSCVIMKRKIFEQIGYFNLDIKIGEDWEYWARIIWNNYRVKFINQQLTYIRIHSNSYQSQTNTNIWKHSTEKVLKSFLDFKNISNKQKSLIFKKMIFVNYVEKDDLLKHFKLLTKCIKYNHYMVCNFKLLWITFKYLVNSIIRKN